MPGRDLVAEALADLGDAERRLHAQRGGDVLEVDEDALRGLGPQVGERGIVANRPDRGLEHQVERACLGEVAVGCLAGPLRRPAAAGGVGDVVGAVAVLAGAAVDERIGEAADVARGDPDLRVEDDRGVEQHDVVALLHHRPLPGGLDVLLEEDAVVAVVVGRAEAAVDVRRRVHEPAPAAEGRDLLDRRRALVALELSHPLKLAGTLDVRGSTNGGCRRWRFGSRQADGDELRRRSRAVAAPDSRRGRRRRVDRLRPAADRRGARRATSSRSSATSTGGSRIVLLALDGGWSGRDGAPGARAFPNGRHRADLQKLIVQTGARGRGIGRSADGRGRAGRARRTAGRCSFSTPPAARAEDALPRDRLDRDRRRSRAMPGMPDGELVATTIFAKELA